MSWVGYSLINVLWLIAQISSWATGPGSNLYTWAATQRGSVLQAWRATSHPLSAPATEQKWWGTAKQVNYWCWEAQISSVNVLATYCRLRWVEQKGDWNKSWDASDLGSYLLSTGVFMANEYTPPFCVSVAWPVCKVGCWTVSANWIKEVVFAGSLVLLHPI